MVDIEKPLSRQSSGASSGANRLPLRTALAVFILFMTGCAASTIDIEGSYPSPLVRKIPATLGVYYADGFRDYSFTEVNEVSGEDQYIINSGASQVALFNTVLPAVFERVVEIEDLDSLNEYPEIDMVFVPTIEEFQLGLPQKTRLDVYEIWVKYNMRLSEADGDEIADWVMTAYGKSPQETFSSVDRGVNEAAVVALRDLGASFSLGFSSVPEVSQWLQEHNLLTD